MKPHLPWNVRERPSEVAPVSTESDRQEWSFLVVVVAGTDRCLSNTAGQIDMGGST